MFILTDDKYGIRSVGDTSRISAYDRGIQGIDTE